MTQALLNNLNINTNDFMSDKKADVAASDKFDKIFQSQKELETHKNNSETSITIKVDEKTEAPTASYTSNEPKLPDDSELAKELQEFIDGYNPYISEEEDEDENTEETGREEEGQKEVEAKDLTLIDLPAINNIAADSIIQNDEKVASQDKTVETEDALTSETETTLDLTSLELEPNDTVVEDAACTKEVRTNETEGGKQLEEIVDEDIFRELNIESVEAEASGSGDESDLMRNQTPQEQGVKAMLHADVEFNNVEFEANPETTATKPTTEATPGRIIEQVAKHLEGLNSGSKVNIVLNPESLGKVSVQLINTKEGLSAQFTVATQEARNLILKGLDGLKETLLSQGVSVDNVSVKLNDAQESEYNSDWTDQENSNNGNKEQGKQQERNNKQDFEQMMFSAQNDNENGNV